MKYNNRVKKNYLYKAVFIQIRKKLIYLPHWNQFPIYYRFYFEQKLNCKIFNLQHFLIIFILQLLKKGLVLLFIQKISIFIIGMQVCHTADKQLTPLQYINHNLSAM